MNIKTGKNRVRRGAKREPKSKNTGFKTGWLRVFDEAKQWIFE
jgi:hypothetical protein